MRLPPIIVRVLLGPFFFCANGADKFDVGDILEAVARDFRFGDNFDHVGTFYPSAYTLCKASNSLAAEVFQVSLNLG